MNSNIFLSLGSNLGDRLDHLSKATDAIRLLGSVSKISSVYQTAPVGFKEQDDFMNLALQIECEFNVFEFHQKLLEIEKHLGRVRIIKNGPRIIDIDIIFFGDRVMRTDSLTLPHPRYMERNFVLAPLAEIAPEYICPWQKKSVQILYQNSPDTHAVRRLSLSLTQ